MMCGDKYISGTIFSFKKLVGLRHVIARPSADGRLTTRQLTLNGIDGEKGILF
jgi:hypothetical protein